jgi:uncharacterized membrane protein (DUF106 family)
MPTTLLTIQNLIKSYNDYKTELSRQLNLDEIKRLEEEQRVTEAAAKAAAQPKGTTPAR